MKRFLLALTLILYFNIIVIAQSNYTFELITPDNLTVMSILQTFPADDFGRFHISEDNEWIMTLSRMRSEINLLNISNNDNVVISIESDNILRDERISPNSQYVVARDVENIWLWDIRSGELIEQFQDNGFQSRQANYTFSRDDRYFIFSTIEDDVNIISVYDTTQNEIIMTLEQPHVTQVLLSPNEETLLSISENGDISQLWLWQISEDFQEYTSTVIFEGNKDEFVYDIGYTLSGEYALIMIEALPTFNKNLLIWDTLSNQEFGTNDFEQASFLPNQYTNLIGIRVAPTEFLFVDSIHFTPYPTLMDAVNLIDVNSHGTIAVTSGAEGDIFWNIVTGEQIMNLEDMVSSQFSPNGNLLISLNTQSSQYVIQGIASEN